MNKITELRQKHKESLAYHMAKTGDRYYHSKNDITKRKMYIYTEGGLIEDVYKANNKIASAYAKLIIDQLINYIIGQNPMTPIEDLAFIKQLKDVATDARVKGQQWVQAYTEDGEFKTKLIPTVELYPIYEDEKLIEMWRFYTVDSKDRALRYTMESIEEYDENNVLIETRPAMSWKITEGANQSVEGDTIEALPFVRMKANKDCIYDIEPYKALIDAYDLVISDFANNLEDFQDVTWILKGYTGQNVTEFTKQVKMYKSIPVGAGGDARSETIEIPHEARMKMLEQSENLIFKFGFGVNLDSLSGGSLTNVAIKSQFANLDMKANAFAQEIEQYINDYIDLYNIYAAKTNKALIQKDEIKFNKATIINEVELLKANAEQQGAVSEETRLANHAWVDDVKEEVFRMNGLIKLEDD